MAAPALDRPAPDRFPDGHSIDAHLDAERAALHAERTAAAVSAETERRKARWQLIRAAGLGFALAGTIAVGWNHTHQPDPKPRFCTADGYTTADGEQLTRDVDQGRAWVDADGHRVPVDSEGQPTG